MSRKLSHVVANKEFVVRRQGYHTNIGDIFAHLKSCFSHTFSRLEWTIRESQGFWTNNTDIKYKMFQVLSKCQHTLNISSTVQLKKWSISSFSAWPFFSWLVSLVLSLAWTTCLAFLKCREWWANSETSWKPHARGWPVYLAWTWFNPWLVNRDRRMTAQTVVVIHWTACLAWVENDKQMLQWLSYVSQITDSIVLKNLESPSSSLFFHFEMSINCTLKSLVRTLF